MAVPSTFTTDYLRRLELLRIRSRRTFLGTRQGGHISLKRGHGMEFADYRAYDLGDDPRHIDWGLYGRTEKLYVKRFQEEQDLSVLLLVDGSASMHVPERDGKWAMARDVALSLGYISLMQQDRVTVSVPGVAMSPFYSGGSAFHSMSRFLYSTQSGDQKELVRGVQHAVSRLRFPGVAVIISDFLMPIEDIQSVGNTLRAKNLDILAVQILGPNDIAPFEELDYLIAVDSETGDEVELALTEDVREEYGVRLAEHNHLLREYLAEARIGYALGISNQPVPDFVVNELSKATLLQ